MNCSASPYMQINFFSEEVKKNFFILASEVSSFSLLP